MAEGSPLRCVGYIRCSTQEEGENGGGLAAQRQAIEHEAARRGWQLTTIIEDVGVSGGTHVENRPGGARVLAMLRTGEVDCLIVSKVDRLARSLQDVAGLLDE